MKLMPIAGLAALLVAGAGSVALAQSQPDTYNPNVQAAQDYQAQQNAYQNQADAAARAQDDYAQQRDVYDQRSASYRAERRAYQHRLHEYERARADYDALYGPGSYERIYPVPVAPY